MQIRLFQLLVFLGFSHSILSQSIPIVDAELNGEKINIHYDLVGMEGEVYRVNVYNSLDDFTAPLQGVQGDLDIQRPGYQKLIVWEARDQLGFYTGEITFEIRAEKIYEPIRVMGPFPRDINGKIKYKTKSNMKIEWQGGQVGETVTITLLQGDSSSGFTEIGEVGKKINEEGGNTYKWKIPKKIVEDGEKTKIKTAKNYAFKLSGTSEYGEDKYAKGYYIKRTSPLPGLIFLGVLGGAAVGADWYLGTGFIFPVDDGGTDPTEPVDEDLPAPPDPF